MNIRVLVVMVLGLWGSVVLGGAGGQPEGGFAMVVDSTTAALIAEIEMIPAEQGSKIDRNRAGAQRVPKQQRPRAERIANELKRRFYDASRVTEEDEAAFVRIARGEPANVLTDPGSMRGEMYLYIFDALLRQKRLSYEDERWARSVHQLHIEHPVAVDPHWFAYAKVRVRRLARDHQWRVQVDKVLYEPIRLGDWDSWDGWYDLRPVGKGNLDWWDYNQRIYSELIRYSGYWDPNSVTREVAGRIFEGDEYIDIWWPVGEFDERVKFEWARVKKTPVEQGASGWYERVESIEGYELIDEPRAYLEWLATHLRVQVEHSDRDEWLPNREITMPDRFRFYLPTDKGDRNPDLPAFTFGGLISVVLEFAPGGRYDGPMPLKRVVPLKGEPAWWALRNELDDDGNRVFANDGGAVPLMRAEQYRGPGAALNDHLVGAYIEIRFGMEVLGDDGYRAIADIEAERFIAETVRIPIRSHGIRHLLAAVKAHGRSLDIGYKDLYEEGEIEALMNEYDAEGYFYRQRGSGGSGWTGTP